MFHILALCAGNASRSILTEAILNRDGADRIKAWSAGPVPKGMVDPAARTLLARRGAETSGLRSKGWEEFASTGAPKLDLVIALCPTVRDAIQPDWPGQPLVADWPVQDPAGVPADQLDLAMQQIYHRISVRMNALLTLPLETMTKQQLAQRLIEIREM